MTTRQRCPLRLVCVHSKLANAQGLCASIPTEYRNYSRTALLLNRSCSCLLEPFCVCMNTHNPCQHSSGVQRMMRRTLRLHVSRSQLSGLSTAYSRWSLQSQPQAQALRLWKSSQTLLGDPPRCASCADAPMSHTWGASAPMSSHGLRPRRAPCCLTKPAVAGVPGVVLQL